MEGESVVQRGCRSRSWKSKFEEQYLKIDLPMTYLRPLRELTRLRGEEDRVRLSQKVAEAGERKKLSNREGENEAEEVLDRDGQT
jgi:hypothetical protein